VAIGGRGRLNALHKEVIDLAPELGDFSDTAAALAALDLWISPVTVSSRALQTSLDEWRVCVRETGTLGAANCSRCANRRSCRHRS
jgi:hypothetical protein